MNVTKVRLKSHHFLIYQYGAIYKTKVFRYDEVYGLAKKFNVKHTCTCTCTIICEDKSLFIKLCTDFVQIYVGMFKFK